MEGFPPETFRSRRERALAALGEDAMVLPAAPVLYSSRDTAFPYRPDSELFYLTGVAEPDAVAVLRGHADEERFVLFVRPRDPEAELWTGPRHGPERAAEVFGADATWPIEEMEDRLPELLRGARRVFYRLDDRRNVERLVRKALEWGRSRGPRSGRGPRGVVDPGEILDDMRLVKDSGEIRRIRQAALITAETHRDAMARVRPGMGEWEVEAFLDGTFRALGGDGPGYETIVGAGGNACVLHYVANEHTIDRGDLVLVDAGASLGLYCADITRTFPGDGAFSAEQRAVYDIVERARRDAVEVAAPGATIGAVHDAAVAALVKGLVELEVLDGDPDELVADEAYKDYFPHRTSHWLGLDVHDVGDYARNGESRTLEPGMVFTVEPGLYFSPDAGGPAARFACIGVRIEDDVLITEEGCDVLTRAVPTDPDEIEALVGSAAT